MKKARSIKVFHKTPVRRVYSPDSRISKTNASQGGPSGFEVVAKISVAMGFQLELHPDTQWERIPRLNFARNVLGLLRNELRLLGVRHAVVFGSVARGEDKEDSDVDIYLEFSKNPSVAKQLKAEGRVIEAFGDTKADIISRVDSEKGRRLMVQIEKDGVRVF